MIGLCKNLTDSSPIPSSKIAHVLMTSLTLGSLYGSFLPLPGSIKMCAPHHVGAWGEGIHPQLNFQPTATSLIQHHNAPSPPLHPEGAQSGKFQSGSLTMGWQTISGMCPKRTYSSLFPFSGKSPSRAKLPDLKLQIFLPYLLDFPLFLELHEKPLIVEQHHGNIFLLQNKHIIVFLYFMVIFE